jgi:tetratricopeptide (TPR) repeat protein
MIRMAAIVLIWAAVTGAFYEWGGNAARGVRDLKKGKHREALESLRKGRTELPRSAAVRYDEGLAFRGLGLADSALAAYNDAAWSPGLEGDPARSAAAYNMGNEAMRAQKYAEAMRQYRHSLRLDPTRVDAKKNLEEAIRRARNEEQKRQGGGGGRGPQSEGTQNPESGKGGTRGQQGSQSQPNQPGVPQSFGKSPTPQLGNAIPDRAEAEHWLDALESERRAARLRDRGRTEQSEGQRDW